MMLRLSLAAAVVFGVVPSSLATGACDTPLLLLLQLLQTRSCVCVCVCVVWCGVVWCGVVWCGVVCACSCARIRCTTTLHNSLITTIFITHFFSFSARGDWT
jgi:hypothetical protein